MQENCAKSKAAVYAPIAVSLGILVWLVYPNFGPLKEALAGANPLFLLAALACAGLCYTFMGLSLWEVLKILGHRLPFWEAAGVAFVSTTVNYFVSSGGVSGFATRAHLLSKRHIPYGISVTSSVVISVFIYLVLSVIIVEGMLLQLFSSGGELNARFFEGVLGVLFILSFAFALVLIFFNARIRSAWSRKLYHGVNRLLYFFSKKEIPEETFVQFEHQLSSGIATIHHRKFELPKVVAFVCCDWICNILILYFCFRAMGVSLGAGKLVIGFAFGQLMTVIPILPGGLGAMEAAMTAAYSQMGVPVGAALAAALAFRTLYYLVPGFVSIFIYWGLRMSEPYYRYFPSRGEACHPKAPGHHERHPHHRNHSGNSHHAGRHKGESHA